MNDHHRLPVGFQLVPAHFTLRRGRLALRLQIILRILLPLGIHYTDSIGRAPEV